MKFYKTPIQLMILKQKIKADKQLKNAFKKNVTKEINEDIKQRIEGIIENFFTMHITGSQGSMKSSVAIEFANKFDETFNSKRISFEYEEYLRKMKESKPKQIHQIDEQVFMRGTGSLRMIQEIQEHIEVLRRRQNSLIIISPEQKYFRENLFTYTLETIDNQITATCPKNQEEHEPRECQCYQEKSSNIKNANVRLAVKTGERYIGHYIMPINWKNPHWKEYEKAKDEFMKQTTMGERKRTEYEKIAEEIMKNPETQRYKNKKGLRILVEKTKPNLTITETDLVIEAISIKRKETR